MTRAGGGRFLAVAASLALHAGALAVAWQLPPAQPRQPMPVLVTLLAPPAPTARLATDSAADASALTRHAPPLRGSGAADAGSSAASERDDPVADVPPERAIASAGSGPEPAARESLANASSSLASSTPQRDYGHPSTVETSTDASSNIPVAVLTDAATAGPSTEMAIAAAPATYTSGQVLASLAEAFAAHFHYPPLARRKGWEGAVTLALRVEIDGRLTGIHVVGSSGYRVLDNAAVASLLRARALPLPGGALGGSLDMVLPVHYRLLDARV